MSDKDKQFLIKIGEKCGPLMQDGLKDTLNYLFKDGMPKTNKDLEGLIGGEYKDVHVEVQAHLEAWAIYILAKCVREYEGVLNECNR